MRISKRHLSLLALLAWAAPLTAQETPAPADGAEAQPAEETAAPAAEAPGVIPGLDMGEPVETGSGEPRVGEPYAKAEFGDWLLRCLRTEEGNDPCNLYQLLLDDQGNAVAEISMFPMPPGNEAVAGATIVVPLETLLTEQLTLSVDGTSARRYPFTFCNRAGCVARVGFTAEEVEQFKRGNAAQLTLVPAAAPDQQVDLDISLSGFTAGFAETPAPSLDAPAE